MFPEVNWDTNVKNVNSVNLNTINVGVKTHFYEKIKKRQNCHVRNNREMLLMGVDVKDIAVYYKLHSAK